MRSIPKKNIVLHGGIDEFTKVTTIHRCYDAPQYPVIHCDDADGYYINVKMINPVSGEETCQFIDSKLVAEVNAIE